MRLLSGITAATLAMRLQSLGPPEGPHQVTFRLIVNP